MTSSSTPLVLSLLLVASTLRAQSAPHFENPPSLPPARGYSQIVEVPPGYRYIFISGQVPLDSTGVVVGAGHFPTQARQVFQNLDRALRAAGATFADVVKLTFYVVDVGDLRALREVRDAFINPAAPPASTLVEVRRLFRDDVMLEVEAMAAVRP